MAKFVLRLITMPLILGSMMAFSLPDGNNMKMAFDDALDMRFLENSKFSDMPTDDVKRWNQTIAMLKLKNQTAGLNDDDLEQKVIGGRDAQEREFPWMISLHYNGRFLCSAFLISPTLVMTAAHCVVLNNGVEPASAFHGIVGNIARDGPEKKITFSEVAAHPRYGENTEFDIAVFRTSESVEINDAVQTVCLPKAGQQFEAPVAQAMGWGVARRGGDSAAETLQTATLPVPSIAMCRLVYRFLSSEITNNHVCAGGLNSGICFGDSGGPLVNMNDSEKPVAVGVASFVSFLGCARPFIPAVYTATSSYIDWLSETVRNTTDICFV